MKKRILVAFLWFYACWYGAAHVASFLAIDPLIGPIVGAVAAAFVAVDPIGLFWPREAKPRRASETIPDPG